MHAIEKSLREQQSFVILVVCFGDSTQTRFVPVTEFYNAYYILLYTGLYKVHVGLH